eukprot:Nk52_evm5s267 gene=Nk52_evmTU5s267
MRHVTFSFKINRGIWSVGTDDDSAFRTVYLAGSEPQLGNWLLSYALPLKYKGEGTYVGEGWLEKGKDVKYRLVYSRFICPDVNDYLPLVFDDREFIFEYANEQTKKVNNVPMEADPCEKGKRGLEDKYLISMEDTKINAEQKKKLIQSLNATPATLKVNLGSHGSPFHDFIATASLEKGAKIFLQIPKGKMNGFGVQSSDRKLHVGSDSDTDIHVRGDFGLTEMEYSPEMVRDYGEHGLKGYLNLYRVRRRLVYEAFMRYVNTI